MKSKTTIDKFFFIVWNSIGGISTATYPHGICYAFKCLLKPEIPRDYGDNLLSLKHPPYIVISDIPHILASHINKRVPDFFYPHGGRIAEPTPHNVELVKNGNFVPVSLHWLGKCMEKATPDLRLGETPNFS